MSQWNTYDVLTIVLTTQCYSTLLDATWRYSTMLDAEATWLADLAGRLGRQTWPADLAGRLGGQTWPADLAGRLGRQTWPADLAGRLGRQTWPARLVKIKDWKPTLFHFKKQIKNQGSSPWTIYFKIHIRTIIVMFLTGNFVEYFTHVW
jgi:hypothetical protein